MEARVAIIPVFLVMVAVLALAVTGVVLAVPALRRRPRSGGGNPLLAGCAGVTVAVAVLVSGAIAFFFYRAGIASPGGLVVLGVFVVGGIAATVLAAVVTGRPASVGSGDRPRRPRATRPAPRTYGFEWFAGVGIITLGATGLFLSVTPVLRPAGRWSWHRWPSTARLWSSRWPCWWRVASPGWRR